MHLNPGIHHICLVVQNLQSSLDFYDRIMPVLGWKARRSPESTAYSTGLYELYLQEGKELQGEFHRYGIGLQHLAFNAPSREAVDHLYRHLQKIEAVITDVPKEYPQYHEGYYAIFFEDPSGIQLEYCYTPGFEF